MPMPMPGPLGTSLPPPQTEGMLSLEQAVQRRRTVRAFAGKGLGLADLSQLLWAAQGVTCDEGLRAAPSAGARYPLEVYAVVADVAGLLPGLYRYDCQRHDLTLLEEGDRRPDLAAASLDQDWVATAPVVLILTALPERTTEVYGRRGHRYIDMEAGHAAQNVCLQAVARGLGVGLVGAFGDNEIRALVGRESEEPLYLLAIGRPR